MKLKKTAKKLWDNPLFVGLLIVPVAAVATYLALNMASGAGVTTPCNCTTSGATQTTACQNGTTITSSTCDGCHWISTGNSCASCACSTGQTQTLACPNGTTVNSATCDGCNWTATGTVCPGGCTVRVWAT